MKLRLNRGMTIIEVVIAIAILGIISVVMISVFTSGFLGIISAGKHSEVGYEAQEDMENAIFLNTGVGTDYMVINFQGGPVITVDGIIIDKEVEIDTHNISVKTFIPNP